jgi:hypothetical protein
MPNSQENSARTNGVIFGGAVGIAVCLVLAFWPYQKSVSGETDIITVEFSADGKKLLGGTREEKRILESGHRPDAWIRLS